MQRIRVRIVHENKPYDGVFNGYDDLVLLKLFIRIITGCDPTLPKGTFESVGVTPDFYLIESKDLSWPLKKWVQLPACIRKVCQERDTDDAPSKKGPVRVEETSGQGDETDELLKQDELAAVQAAEAEEMSDKTPNVNDSPKSAHTEIKAEVEPVPETADGLKSSSAVPEPEICVPVQAEPVADETKVTTPADEPAKVDATEPTEKPEEKPEVAKEPEVKPVEKTDDSADNVTTESAPTPEEPPVAVETVADEPAGTADEPAPVPADEPVAPTPAEPIPDQSEDSAPTEATSQPAVDEKPKQAPPAQAAQANKKKQNKKKNKKKK